MPAGRRPTLQTHASTVFNANHMAFRKPQGCFLDDFDAKRGNSPPMKAPLLAWITLSVNLICHTARSRRQSHRLRRRLRP